MNKIFINALSAKLGGGQTYILNLLNNIPDTCDVTVILHDFNMLNNYENLSVIKSSFASRNMIFRFIWEFFYLPFFLKLKKFDILFVPGGMDFNFFTFGIPKVTMFRNMLPFDKVALENVDSFFLKLKNYTLKFLMLRTMFFSDSVIYISNYAKNVISHYFKNDNDPVIYHGISEKFIRQTEESINSNVLIDNDFLLYVSRFEPYKNHFNLIVAYSLLPDNLKAENHLVLIGELMEPEYSKCLNFIKDHNLNDKVMILGKVDYNFLPFYYSRCKLFIFPSSCENCPNIMLEALGCEAPIIASSSMPMPEFAGDDALFFDERDAHSIKRSIFDALSNEYTMESLRLNSIKNRIKYNWSVTATDTWNFLIERCKNV